MKTWITLTLFAAAMLAAANPAEAAVRIFACEPEWGALAKELGGPDVDVYTATSGLQDPHHIQARPSLIARVRRSDLIVATGAQLEIGWLPVLLRQSANPAVQPGQPGYFEATRYVRMLEVPGSVDRIHGDVHPGGNPHIQSDPRNILQVATALNQRLQQLDPAHARDYQQRYAGFSQRWRTAIEHWQQLAAPLKGVKLIAYHKAWIYMLHWLSMQEVSTIEPVPGVPPSAAHLGELLAEQRMRPAALIIYAAYQDPQAPEWLSKRAGIPAVMLPFTVGGTDQAKNLFGLYDDTIHRLLQAVKH